MITFSSSSSLQAIVVLTFDSSQSRYDLQRRVGWPPPHYSDSVLPSPCLRPFSLTTLVDFRDSTSSLNLRIYILVAVHHALDPVSKRNRQ